MSFTLQGIVAAPFLPMRPDYAIDWNALDSYMRWIAAQQPAAIAMNMDASEGPSLTRDEQLEVLRVCRESIGGTVPLLSGLIAASTADAVSWGEELKRAGAQALAGRAGGGCVPAVPGVSRQPGADRDDLPLPQGDRRRRRPAADRVPVSEG